MARASLQEISDCNPGDHFGHSRDAVHSGVEVVGWWWEEDERYGGDSLSGCSRAEQSGPREQCENRRGAPVTLRVSGER